MAFKKRTLYVRFFNKGSDTHIERASLRIHDTTGWFRPGQWGTETLDIVEDLEPVVGVMYYRELHVSSNGKGDHTAFLKEGSRFIALESLGDMRRYFTTIIEEALVEENIFNSQLKKILSQ